MVCGEVWLQEQIPKRHHVFKRDWTTCSQYFNLYKINSQHNFGGGGCALYDHLMSTSFFSLIMNKLIIHVSPGYREESGYSLNFELQTLSDYSSVS